MSSRLTNGQRKKMQALLEQKREASVDIEAKMYQQRVELKALEAELEEAEQAAEAHNGHQAAVMFPGEEYADSDAEQDEAYMEEQVEDEEEQGTATARLRESESSLRRALGRVNYHMAADEREEAFMATVDLAKALWVQSDTRCITFEANNAQLKTQMARYRVLMDDAGVDYRALDAEWSDEANDMAAEGEGEQEGEGEEEAVMSDVDAADDLYA